MNKKVFMKNAAVLSVTAIISVLLGMQLPVLVKKWRGPIKTGDYRIHVSQQKNKLTLYGTTTCQYCAGARSYLHQAGIPFNDLIIDKSKEAEKAFKELNETGVPVLVSSSRLVVGFDRAAYDELNRIENLQ